MWYKTTGYNRENFNFKFALSFTIHAVKRGINVKRVRNTLLPKKI